MTDPKTEPERPTHAARPRLPSTPWTWLVIAYAVYGAAVLLLFLAAGLLGWSAEGEERDALPLSVRQAPGGYRSYHLWHSGYQGGK
jgi:hypothetical protein